jgi:acetylglutamate kinase
MTRFLEERGIKSQFVNGLRVTTDETIDALIKVLAGSVNQNLVAALIEAGALAVGLSGVDANMVVARQMDPALGAVGEVTQSRAELLNILTQCRFLPVVACLAGAAHRGCYNLKPHQKAVSTHADWFLANTRWNSHHQRATCRRSKNVFLYQPAGIFINSKKATIIERIQGSILH